MKKRVVDLTAEELSQFAVEAWGDAARTSLANGFSVTGSRGGRRFRFHSDGEANDLGVVATIPGQNRQDSDDAARFAQVQLQLPKLEMSAAVQELAEKNLVEAQLHFERIKAATDKALLQIEEVNAAAARGAAEYGIKLIEVARTNTHAAFDFATSLMEVRSMAEMIELAHAHARAQFEGLSGQMKELSALASKIASETASEAVEIAGGAEKTEADQSKSSRKSVA